MKNILITGGYGYIGTYIYKSICNEYNVIRFTHEQCNLLNIDDVNRIFNNNYFDIVIHAAILGGNRTVNYDDSIVYNNVCMLNNLLRYRNMYTYFINIGSGLQFSENSLSNIPYNMSKKII